jgi:hypothetical protein
MSWDVPDRRWQFVIGDDPPDGLPTAWATASQAITRDLGCRRHGRPITFTNVAWCFLASDASMAVGFELAGEASVDAYQRCRGYRVNTSTAQALAWLADDVQSALTGYEFVQWPIAGQRILEPRIVDDQAVWVDPRNDAIIAPIGGLCEAPDGPTETRPSGPVTRSR